MFSDLTSALGLEQNPAKGYSPPMGQARRSAKESQTEEEAIVDDQPATTSGSCLEDLEQECERMGLPPGFVRQYPTFRNTLITHLVLEPLAKSFAEAWEHVSDEVSDEEFCKIFLGFLSGDGNSGFYVKVPSLLLSSDASLPVPLLLALVLSMYHEFERRMLSAETPEGTLLRKLAASRTLSQEDFARLQAAQPWRRHNPEGKEENSSCFILALLEKLVATEVPSLSSKEGLLKFLSGWLNDLPADADNVVRVGVETAQRRSRTLKAIKERRVQPLQCQDLNVEFASVDRPILLAEIRSLESLTGPERQAIELGLQDLTQEDIASRLKVSKPRVNQLRSSAIRKIRQAMDLS